MKPRVILRDCREYDPDRIASIISEGMEELGIRPRGHTLVKPNTVIAHPRYFRHAFTRPEFLDGLLTALKQRGEGMTELVVGERCGITIPTRYSFAEAGYNAVLRRHRVRARYFDEEPQVEVRLESPPALRPYTYAARSIVECDFFVNAPKFKAQPWVKVTFALKNLIGIQDDKHRLIDHDYMLEHKIADLQQIVSPGFIAMDAIIAGEKTMLTPNPFPLGLIVMAVNPVATDVVCSHIVGLDPREVDYIRLSAERGLGPLDLDQIEVVGDVTLEGAQARAEGFELTLGTVEDIFNDHQSNITTYAGPPPGVSTEPGEVSSKSELAEVPDWYDYCWGGCPGGLFEAVQIIEALQPGVYREVRPLCIAFGDVRGRRIDAAPGERVLFMGDCAMFDGKIAGKPVHISSIYVSREQKDPHHAKSSDLLAKILKFLRLWISHRGKQVIHVPGCPVSVAENVLFVSALGRTKIPYLDRYIFVHFVYYYVIFNVVRFFRVTLGGLFRR
ncbi:MAG: DUF362 domain-containing protein [Anaerolineae bacterium]